MPILTQGLIDACKTRPDDVIDYLVSTKRGKLWWVSTKVSIKEKYDAYTHTGSHRRL